MIDWGEPIECDHGELKLGMSRADDRVVRLSDVYYSVNNSTGEPISHFLGTKFNARNVKTNRDKAIDAIRNSWDKTPTSRLSAEMSVAAIIEAGLLVED